MKFHAIQPARPGPRPDDADLMASLDQPAVTLLLDGLADGIILADAAGRIRCMNAMAEVLNGVDRTRHLGGSISALADASTIDWTEIVDAFHGHKKTEVMTRGADEAPVLFSLRFLRAPEGAIQGALFVQRDLRHDDYLRRAAEPVGRRAVFKFAADRRLQPDFAAQRRLSRALDQVLLRGERALRQSAGVLLTGESGAGKTEIAKHLHAQLAGPGEPFVHVNCASVPETLFESEMFGHERGAFTGALRSGKRGLIETAEGGCLFLDEVGEIPMLAQAKLLKFLEDGMVQRLGGAAPRRVRTRVIAATNRDIYGMVAQGQFRRDLYYRLAVVAIEVPALRREPALRDHLIDYFLHVVSQARGAPLTLSAGCREALRDYSYPGNIRELHNVLQQVSVMAEAEAALADLPPHLVPQLVGSGDDEAQLRDKVRAYEKRIIEEAIERHGSKRKAARALGVDIGTIVRKTRDCPAERMVPAGQATTTNG